jgi:hypothetical protein
MIFQNTWTAPSWQSRGGSRKQAFKKRSSGPNETMKNQTLPRRAPGGPNIEPWWTHGAKVAVGK